MKATGQRMWFGQVAIGALCCCLLALVGRLTYIQTQMRPELLKWSLERQTSKIPLPGRRGRLLDRRLRVLAGSHDQSLVFADPALIKDRAETATQVADVLGVPAREILEKLEKARSSRYVVLRRGVDDETVKALQKESLPGIGVTNEPARVYAMGTLAAHVIGYVGAEGTGLEGIELACEKFLRYKPGQRIVYWDSRRKNVVSQDPDGYVAPKDGLDVVLTIDAAIQEILERELAKTVEKFKPQCALGIVMSPKTGEVLALGISPTYDPAAPGKVPAEVRRNRLLTDPVEPGSIFKPFVLVGALQAGLTRPDEVLFCHNGLYVIGKRLLHDHHPYGNLTVEQVITKSSNIGMAILGMRMGNQLMHDTLRALGFGRRTGIDLPGEDNGLLWPVERWQTPYTTTSVPMGHEMAMTPIQLATAFCALVNGGRLPKPYVVAGVVDHSGRVVEDRRPKDEFPQVVDPATAETVKQILVKTVNEGTGKPSALEHWQVLGKTGTAQMPYSPEDRRRLGLKKGLYEPNAYLGSFLAAAPASDPEVVVLVMVRKPDRRIGYYGGTVAAPAVKAILQQVLAYLNVPHDRVKPTTDSTSLATDLRD
ncbi:MAG TPA: penicillin-binding protein 2 [Phycisphaerae bacterium]|jgi:cell division protein FtsI/penicillin-binding protein 2|nr:penicillin-binding protein 2 [Phycisphaerae bacterium]HOB75417.1 penicillin-binding protein 2 [Phycisphaerae bacterium]HOJ55650.1 penicillin-binding protein 2 [Phycisphaerae bacterium]HOL27661.1 penicillin-binding protein 2 [Phycisphaerae bacterium]HPP21963.1 penicillin-binding protein 2 [Phycisphaerae bacterium]